LNHHLLDSHAAGRRTILIIDEAQNLCTEVLEQIRLLTNLETAQAKLLQIILIGQPELQTLLARNELRQLAQRITARYHLGSLNREETRTYIAHRLRVSGGHADLFSPRALDDVHKLSAGVPRLINVICDRALLGAYVEDKRHVDRAILRHAAVEVLPEFRNNQSSTPLSWPWAAAILVFVLAGSVLWWERLVTPTAESQSLPPITDSASTMPNPSETDIAQEPPENAEAATDVTDPNLLPPPDPLETDVLPEPSGLPDRLSAAVDESSELRAWSGLFKLWNMALYLDDQLMPCDQAAKQGMRCLVRSGNWTQLRSFDRPAILQMIAPGGQRVSVLLRGLQGEQAIIELGSEVLRLPISEIDAHWHGQFMLLWRSPVGSETLRAGARGEDVLWLRTLLDRLLPEAAMPSVTPNLYDAALAERVKQFQSSQALNPDGVVGIMTLIHLNSADQTSGGPRLTDSAT
jgi:general secretion pathway protein A